MILELSEACPVFEANAEVHLQRLLYAVAVQGWHLIAVPSPDRLEVLLPPHLWRTYREFLRQSYKQVINSPMTIASHSDCSSCDPALLITFYTLPVLILVEDVHSDGEWVRFIAIKLRPRLARRMTSRYPDIEFRHAGGIGQIPAELRRLSKQYRANRPADRIPLRIAAISDGDAKLPGVQSADARAVVRAGAETGADVHVLRKRTIENYVPDEALLNYAAKHDSQRAAEYITSLRGHARDHYPVKAGLTDAELSEVGSLYGNSPPAGLGMGEFMRDYLANSAYSITEGHQLKGRDASGELDELLDLLERNL